MSDGPTVNSWPAAEVAGTTTPRQRWGGGWGAHASAGGGQGSGERIQPEYGPDKTPDTEERPMVIRWQDNRTLVWSKEHTISLARVGPAPITLKMLSMGIYRSRQIEIIMQTAAPLVLVSVEEEAEQLGS